MTDIKYDQYLTEKDLVATLSNSSLAERKFAYKNLYSAFFSKFPQVAYDPNANAREKIGWQIALLRPFLTKDTVFLEIGAGNCLLSVELCRYVKTVIAYEVADEIPHIDNKPANLILKIFNGIDIGESPESIDIIYSNQVFEHLHVDDTSSHIMQYYGMLRKKGKVIIVTPNRLTGPHDISRNYSLTPQGFHIREYTYDELCAQLRSAGFRKVRGFLGSPKLGYAPVSVFFLSIFEKIYDKFPLRLRYRLKESKFLLKLFGIKICAIK